MPVQAKTGAVPADDGFWFDDDENVTPAGPETAEGCPEEPVDGVQWWPRALAFEHGELLTEGEDFEGDVAPAADEGPEGNDECKDGFEHELTCSMP